jgi:hypothetical protein
MASISMVKGIGHKMKGGHAFLSGFEGFLSPLLGADYKIRQKLGFASGFSGIVTGVIGTSPIR